MGAFKARTNNDEHTERIFYHHRMRNLFSECAAVTQNHTKMLFGFKRESKAQQLTPSWALLILTPLLRSHSGETLQRDRAPR